MLDIKMAKEMPDTSRKKSNSANRYTSEQDAVRKAN